MSAVEKGARISECGRYRYWLGRVWDPAPSLVFVMLNPSTADASLDDPTIRRCIGFAKREGAGGLSVLNLYGFRATDPKALLSCGDAVGPENDAYLELALTEQVRRGQPVVAAWGTKAKPSRVDAVLRLAPTADWRCLEVTKDGHPKHPLYVKADRPLITFPAAAPYRRLAS